MTGLPPSFQCWNNVYTNIGNDPMGFPIYKLEAYNISFIPICGAYIYRKNGIWVLEREDGKPIYRDFRKQGSPPQDTPYGYWTEGGKVFPG